MRPYSHPKRTEYAPIPAIAAPKWGKTRERALLIGSRLTELSLDVDLSDRSSDRKGSNTGQEENKREDNDCDDFRDHADTHSDDTAEIFRNRTIDCNHC